MGRTKRIISELIITLGMLGGGFMLGHDIFKGNKDGSLVISITICALWIGYAILSGWSQE